ncbi:MAG: DUF4164 family protein [Rhizomicrobium sp.]
MSRVSLAAERLEKALDRLETVAQPLLKVRDLAQESAMQAEKLSVEREQLAARVAELEENARTLSGLTAEVEGRLDGAIAEIRAALGR